MCVHTWVSLTVYLRIYLVDSVFPAPLSPERKEKVDINSDNHLFNLCPCVAHSH